MDRYADPGPALHAEIHGSWPSGSRKGTEQWKEPALNPTWPCPSPGSGSGDWPGALPRNHWPRVREPAISRSSGSSSFPTGGPIRPRSEDSPGLWKFPPPGFISPRKFLEVLGSQDEPITGAVPLHPTLLRGWWRELPCQARMKALGWWPVRDGRVRPCKTGSTWPVSV